MTWWLFFFKKEFIQLPTRLLQQQGCIIPNCITREHQYKGIRAMKNARESYYVGCDSCHIKQSVSHSFRATWVLSQQSRFITWYDKDYRALKKNKNNWDGRTLFKLFRAYFGPWWKFGLGKDNIKPDQQEIPDRNLETNKCCIEHPNFKHLSAIICF